MFANQELNDRQLRYFGASLTGLLIALAGVAYWKWDAVNFAAVLAAGAVILFVVYYGASQTRRPIYRAFRTITYPLQWVMTILILSTIFFVVLTPIGLLLRLSGKTMRQGPDDSPTYWTKRRSTEKKSRYFETY